MEQNKIKHPIKTRMTIMFLVALVPMLLLAVYLLYSLKDYSNSYDELVSNMTVANSYNINFKEEMDESIYKLVVGYVTFDNIQEKEDLVDPDQLLSELRSNFQLLERITTDQVSRSWLQTVLRNIDTLEDRIEDIRQNLDEGGHYDENIEMLDKNIYILTELIQENIQYYIYYQTKSMEQLRNRLNGQVAAMTGVCIGILLIALVIAIIAIQQMQRSIVQPIQDLCRTTERIADGDFSVRAEMHTEDEFAFLAGSVNDMTEHLEIMVNKIKEDERKMRQAEMRLLQEQINPHFLYNALDAIVALVESDSSEKAVNMVVSLSQFFRLVLSGGKEMISIRDEELHVRSYLEIQQTRYQDILDYEIHMDPELYPYRIMKMTLQPIVENALYHGIKNKRGKGHMTIRGILSGNSIVLTVEDTGIGMDSETLAKLREDIKKPCKETDRGFGLANVNERIKMNFGSDYGLWIDSWEGEGTRVQVVIPAIFYESNRSEQRAEGTFAEARKGEQEL